MQGIKEIKKPKVGDAMFSIAYDAFDALSYNTNEGISFYPDKFMCLAVAFKSLKRPKMIQQLLELLNDWENVDDEKLMEELKQKIRFLL